MQSNAVNISSGLTSVQCRAALQLSTSQHSMCCSTSLVQSYNVHINPIQWPKTSFSIDDRIREGHSSLQVCLWCLIVYAQYPVSVYNCVCTYLVPRISGYLEQADQYPILSGARAPCPLSTPPTSIHCPVQSAGTLRGSPDLDLLDNKSLHCFQ